MSEDSTDYGMFSDEGNAMVDRLIREARYRARNLVAEPDLLAWIRAAKERIMRAGHSEIWDTMVREAIAVTLDEAWQEAYGHRCPCPVEGPAPGKSGAEATEGNRQ